MSRYAQINEFSIFSSNGNEVAKIYAGTGAMGAGSKVISQF